MSIELFKWKDFKLPKTIFRKLGKEQAHGQTSGNIIEIDERLNGKKLMEIHFHELEHWMFPEKSEEDVIRDSRVRTDYFWRESYRKIDSKEK